MLLTAARRSVWIQINHPKTVHRAPWKVVSQIQYHGHQAPLKQVLLWMGWQQRACCFILSTSQHGVEDVLVIRPILRHSGCKKSAALHQGGCQGTSEVGQEVCPEVGRKERGAASLPRAMCLIWGAAIKKIPMRCSVARRTNALPPTQPSKSRPLSTTQWKRQSARATKRPPCRWWRFRRWPPRWRSWKKH